PSEVRHSGATAETLLSSRPSEPKARERASSTRYSERSAGTHAPQPLWHGSRLSLRSAGTTEEMRRADFRRCFSALAVNEPAEFLARLAGDLGARRVRWRELLAPVPGLAGIDQRH